MLCASLACHARQPGVCSSQSYDSVVCIETALCCLDAPFPSADALTRNPTALRQQQLLTVSLPLGLQHLAQTRGLFGKAERVSHANLAVPRHSISATELCLTAAVLSQQRRACSL